MDDEYGAMNSAGKTYTYPSPYHLESFGTFGHWSGSAAATTSAAAAHREMICFMT